MKNITGGLLIFLSSLIQQGNLQHPSKCSSLISVISLVLETFSLYLLPLSNYTLLSSFHLVASTLLSSTLLKKRLTPSQVKGNLFLILACFISTTICSQQDPIPENSQLSILLNPFFFIWLSTSLLISLILRRKGFFIAKAMMEAGIPSQICTFSLISLKILMIEVEIQESSKKISEISVIFASLVWPAGFLCTSSFIRYLNKLYDAEQVLVGYYLWFLFNCFPVGITVVTAGVEFSETHVSGLFASAACATLGVYLHFNVQKKEKSEDDEEGLNLI